jgi:hypothetical protein
MQIQGLWEVLRVTASQKKSPDWVSWHTPNLSMNLNVKEDCEFEAIMAHAERPCLKTKNKSKKITRYQCGDLDHLKPWSVGKVGSRPNRQSQLFSVRSYLFTLFVL